MQQQSALFELLFWLTTKIINTYTGITKKYKYPMNVS